MEEWRRCWCCGAVLDTPYLVFCLLFGFCFGDLFSATAAEVWMRWMGWDGWDGMRRSAWFGSGLVGLVWVGLVWFGLASPGMARQ